MTKREMFNVIADVFATVDRADRDEVLAGVYKELELLDRKNAKAKERAATKRSTVDPMTLAIEDILNDEPKTVEAIMNELDAEEFASNTPAKVVSRVSRLVKGGKAVKHFVKLDGRKLTAYTKAE